MQPQAECEFSKWRQRLWPVHRSELPKLLPLLFIKFFVSFIYTILHATKDSLVVTTRGSGAEAIPLLKGGFVLVMAFVVMLFYAKLSQLLSRKAIFYSILALFVGFFALFGLYLYPERETLALHGLADYLTAAVGPGFEPWIATVRWWMNSLFFVMAELWGAVVIFLLFWGSANQVCSVKEASRFYTLFGIGSTASIILGGQTIWSLALFSGSSEHLVTWLMLVTTVVGLLMALCYYWLSKGASGALLNQTKEERKREQRSLMSSLMAIVRSPALASIALMVIGYSISVNFVEVIWKGVLKLKYPESVDYLAFMGKVSLSVGIVALSLSLFVSGNLMRKLGWAATALATPLFLGLFSILFFVLYFISYSGGVIAPEFLMPVVILGALHSIACKSMKYCLFDPTKEMAYIPLTQEEKVSGKAAVDVVAARFGKSGSSWMQAALIVQFGSILEIAPFVAPFVLMSVAAWIGAIYKLKPNLQPVKEEIVAFSG